MTVYPFRIPFQYSLVDSHLWEGPFLNTHAMAYRVSSIPKIIREIDSHIATKSIDETLRDSQTVKSLNYFRKGYTPWLPARIFVNKEGVRPTHEWGAGLFSQDLSFGSSIERING